MTRDEPWSWYWHMQSRRFFIRRSGTGLENLPDDVIAVGVAEARKNGRYLDFAIPPTAVSVADMEKGQTWEFRILNGDTFSMTLPRE